MNPSRFAMLCIAAVMSIGAPYSLAQNGNPETEDPGKLVVLQGALRGVDWLNPNVLVHIDVRNGDGQADHWIVEADDPAAMTQRGLAREALRTGDDVIVCGLHRRRSGSVLEGGGVALMDGRTVYFGPAADNCRQAGAAPEVQPPAAANAPIVTSPVQPFVNSPVQPFVSTPVSAFGVAPVVSRGGFGGSSASNKPIILQATIENVEWTNPAVLLHVAGRDANGRNGRWIVASDAPAAMLQLGLPRQELRRGEPVIVCAVEPTGRARQTGAPGGQGGQILIGGGVAFADGRTVYFEAAADSCRTAAPAAQQAISSSKPIKPIVNSPVQPFVTSPVTPFGAPLPNPR